MSNNSPGWLSSFISKRLKKQALEKLPSTELNGQAFSDSLPTQAPQSQNDTTEASPEVKNNTFNVEINGIEFPVQLVPQLVPQQPVINDVSNPNADPEAMVRWLQNPENEKRYPASNRATEDPIAKEEEENPAIEQNPEVAVHKKTSFLSSRALEEFPGADRSNAYMPCYACTNYNLEDNTCKAGIDVEKVQAAKSCSWLNSNFAAFGKPSETDVHHKDEEIYKSDISQSQGPGTRFSSKNLKNIWKK